MGLKRMWFTGVLGCASCCLAQGGCFSSPSRAIAHTGPESSVGFRLQGTLRDPLNQALWAQIQPCGHPEWPVVLLRLRAGAEAIAVSPAKVDGAQIVPAENLPRARSDRPAQSRAAVVTAGLAVTVMQHSDLVQLQFAGVALSTAAIGEQVTVRVGNQQIVSGTARSAGVVELQ